MSQVPFTAYYSFVPKRGSTTTITDTNGVVTVRRSTRNDYLRDAGVTAIAMYDALSVLSNAGLTLANPQSGQLRPFAMFGQLRGGMAFIPQFGNKQESWDGSGTYLDSTDTYVPARVMFTGFYNDTYEDSNILASQQKIIHSNEWYSGPTINKLSVFNGHSSGIGNLIGMLDSNISDIYDADGNNPVLYKLIYSGIIIGHGGLHTYIAS